MKKLIFLITILTLLFSISVSAEPALNDVSKDHWAYESVKELVDRGLFSLYEDGTFRGKEKVSRFQLAEIVANILEDIERGTTDASEEDIDLVRKLSVEFQDELVALAEQGKIFEERIKEVEQKTVIQDEVIAEIKNEDMSNVNENIDNLQKDVTNIIDNIVKIKNLEEELASLKDKTNQEITDLDSKVEKNSSKINDLEKVEVQLKDDFVQNLENKLSVNETRINTLQKEVNELKSQLSNKEQELEDLDTKNNDSKTLLYGAAGVLLLLLVAN
ncbi:MAG: S-layer homology domain-containing protein [Halothermotrichaceae bacterium]